MFWDVLRRWRNNSKTMSSTIMKIQRERGRERKTIPLISVGIYRDIGIPGRICISPSLGLYLSMWGRLEMQSICVSSVPHSRHLRHLWHVWQTLIQSSNRECPRCLKYRITSVPHAEHLWHLWHVWQTLIKSRVSRVSQMSYHICAMVEFSTEGF